MTYFPPLFTAHSDVVLDHVTEKDPKRKNNYSIRPESLIDYSTYNRIKKRTGGNDSILSLSHSGSSSTSSSGFISQPPPQQKNKRAKVVKNTIIDLTEDLANNSESTQNLDSESIMEVEETEISNNEKPSTTSGQLTKEANQGEGVSKDTAVLVFPPSAPDAITVTQSDIDRLNPDEFLNDTIIDFWLRFSHHYFTDIEKDKFLFFNTFFYNSMKKDSIHKWTKKLDIFSYDYIFMPINQNFHWKLAIICFAGTIGNPANTEDKYPCILVLDSLGTNDSTVSPTIRKYLEKEWKKKKDTECFFTTTSIKAIIAKVPLQTNTTDCGVYLLRYIEKFCEKPPGSLNKKKIITELGYEWFDKSEIVNMRKRIKDTIFFLKDHRDTNKTLPSEKPSIAIPSIPRDIPPPLSPYTDPPPLSPIADPPKSPNGNSGSSSYIPNSNDDHKNTTPEDKSPATATTNTNAIPKTIENEYPSLDLNVSPPNIDEHNNNNNTISTKTNTQIESMSTNTQIESLIEDINPTFFLI